MGSLTSWRKGYTSCFLEHLTRFDKIARLDTHIASAQLRKPLAYRASNNSSCRGLCVTHYSEIFVTFLHIDAAVIYTCNM